MKTLLNVLWLVLSGFCLALGYVAFGILACALIVTIPFGIASFRIANYALWPFGRTVIRRADAGFASAVGNLVWLVFGGIWLALGHIISGVLLCLTVIGIPARCRELQDGADLTDPARPVDRPDPRLRPSGRRS